MVVFGDGATNGGAFFESLNNASAQKLPLPFLCENNGYAIGTKITRVAPPFEKQAKKAELYMGTMEVDGMDAIAVYKAVKEAQRMIQDGHGPVFLEAMTCRYEGHSMSDPATYRSKEELEICKARDPIARMEKVLQTTYGVESEQLETWQKKVQKAADAAEPGLEELYVDIFCKGCANVVS